MTFSFFYLFSFDNMNHQHKLFLFIKLEIGVPTIYIFQETFNLGRTKISIKFFILFLIIYYSLAHTAMIFGSMSLNIYFVVI